MESKGESGDRKKPVHSRKAWKRRFSFVRVSAPGEPLCSKNWIFERFAIYFGICLAGMRIIIT
jgi:hypothetical protein